MSDILLMAGQGAIIGAVAGAATFVLLLTGTDFLVRLVRGRV